MLSQSKFFTTLDLASRYWQVEMEPASSEKIAFTTYSGHYEFTKMPFGHVPALYGDSIGGTGVHLCCVFR